MNQAYSYRNYIEKTGRRLSEINPGSDEFALSIDNALNALEILKNSQTAVLGGDILSVKKNGTLVYAYQLWGDEYHCLNWYCDRGMNESMENYINRSHVLARDCINRANYIAKDLGEICYVVFVINNDDK